MDQEKRHKQQTANDEAEAPEAAGAGASSPSEAEAPEATAGQAAEPAAPEGAGPSAEEQIAELKDRLLRAMADTENLRRRAEREREDAVKYAAADFARDMLGVADNLRRAIDSVPAAAREQDADVAKLLSGVDLTERELLKTFEKHGIQRLDPLGEKLDPHLHQAVMRVEDADAEPGTIVEVMQPGYLLRDRLLRPAMVGVAAGRPQNGGAPEAGQRVDTKA